MKISVFIEDREDVHHITHVMRYKEGNHIIITFSDKKVYKCEIISINDNNIELRLDENKILILNYLSILLFVAV